MIGIIASSAALYNFGTEKVSNGEFDTNITGWAKTGNSTIVRNSEVSGNGTTGYLVYNILVNTSGDRFYQNIGLQANKRYLCEFWYRTSVITGNLFILTCSNTSTLANTIVHYLITPSSTWTKISCIINTNTLSYPHFSIMKDGAVTTSVGTLEIDGISVKEIL